MQGMASGPAARCSTRLGGNDQPYGKHRPEAMPIILVHLGAVSQQARCAPAADAVNSSSKGVA